jgi:hypothetical protein
MARSVDVVARWGSARELFSDAPPTADEVPMTLDGRRLDTAEKLVAFLADVDAQRRLSSDST